MTEVLLRDYVEEMRGRLREGHFSQVLELGNHILCFYPKHLETYRLLGETNLEMNEFDAAADLFNRVRSGDPENLVALIGLSIIHEHQGQIEEAIWHLERAFEIQPSNVELRRELLRLYAAHEGKPRPRLKLTPSALARLYARQGLYPQAIQEFRALLRADPGRLDLQVALAEALYREGRKQEAAQVSQTILEKLPFCLKANLLLGSLWAENGVAESETLLKRAYALDPERIVARELRVDHQDEVTPPTLPQLGEAPGTPTELALGDEGAFSLFGQENQPFSAQPSAKLEDKPVAGAPQIPLEPPVEREEPPFDTFSREETEEATSLLQADQAENDQAVPWLQTIYHSETAETNPPPDTGEAKADLTIPWLQFISEPQEETETPSTPAQAQEQAESAIAPEPPVESAVVQATESAALAPSAEPKVEAESAPETAPIQAPVAAEQAASAEQPTSTAAAQVVAEQPTSTAEVEVVPAVPPVAESREVEARPEQTPAQSEPAPELAHQHDENAGSSTYFASRILGDESYATPQFHVGALPAAELGNAAAPTPAQAQQAAAELPTGATQAELAEPALAPETPLTPSPVTEAKIEPTPSETEPPVEVPIGAQTALPTATILEAAETVAREEPPEAALPPVEAQAEAAPPPAEIQAGAAPSAAVVQEPQVALSPAEPQAEAAPSAAVVQEPQAEAAPSHVEAPADTSSSPFEKPEVAEAEPTEWQAMSAVAEAAMAAHPTLPRTGPSIAGALDKLPAWLRRFIARPPSAAPTPPPEAPSAETGATPPVLVAPAAAPVPVETVPVQTTEAEAAPAPTPAPIQAEPEAEIAAAPIVPPVQVPGEAAAPAQAPIEEELPDWLRPTGKAGLAAAEEQAAPVDSVSLPEKQVAPPSPEPEVQVTPPTLEPETQLPDWLTSAPQEPETPPAPVEERPRRTFKRPTTGDGVPAWVRELSRAREEIRARPEPVEPQAESTEEEEIPDWLRAPESTTQQAQEATPATAPEPQAESAEDEGIPDWLRSSNAAGPEAQAPAEFESAARPEAEQLPDWLRPTETAEPVVSAQAPEPREPLPPEPVANKPPMPESPRAETRPPVQVPSQPAVPEAAPAARTRAGVDPEALLATARELRAAGNIAGALEYYERALQRGPRFISAVIADLEEIVELPDAALPAHRLLGDAYAMAGRFKESLAQYRWVLNK